LSDPAAGVSITGTGSAAGGESGVAAGFSAGEVITGVAGAKGTGMSAVGG
jgi:hypothetical protein